MGGEGSIGAVVVTAPVGDDSGLEPEDVAGDVEPPAAPAAAAAAAAALRLFWMAAACMALQCERSDGGSPGIAAGAADWAALAAYICWMSAWWRSAAAEEGGGGAAEGGDEFGAERAGGGCGGGGPGGLAAAADMSIMALAFSAAAAATIKLLFSASVEKRGFLNSRAGSMNPGGGIPQNPPGTPGGIP